MKRDWLARALTTAIMACALSPLVPVALGAMSHFPAKTVAIAVPLLVGSTAFLAAVLWRESGLFGLPALYRNVVAGVCLLVQCGLFGGLAKFTLISRREYWSVIAVMFGVAWAVSVLGAAILPVTRLERAMAAFFAPGRGTVRVAAWAALAVVAGWVGVSAVERVISAPRFPR